MSKTSNKGKFIIDDKFNSIINKTMKIIPSNYILHGKIMNLHSTLTYNTYLVKVDKENNNDDELRILVEIACNIIKFLNSSVIFAKDKIYYVKYSNNICKFMIQDCNETDIKFELILKYKDI
jgi:hypothetical protein